MARPREFDEEAVLEAAGNAFWARGFEATSTRELIADTGLTPSSLYAAFGDKRTLFRRALEHYLARTLRERMDRLEATKSPAHAITGFFHEVIARSVDDRLQRGCMLVNAALEASPADAELRDAVARELAVIERFFHRCFRAGQKAGEISAAHSADDAAKLLYAVLLGVRVLARVRPERALLTAAVRQALALLDLPSLPRTKGASTPRRKSGDR
jgi:TetR/AcrR family transcriptional regulator, transcriptional repressor for nem operon